MTCLIYSTFINYFNTYEVTYNQMTLTLWFKLLDGAAIFRETTECKVYFYTICNVQTNETSVRQPEHTAEQ